MKQTKPDGKGAVQFPLSLMLVFLMSSCLLPLSLHAEDPEPDVTEVPGEEVRISEPSESYEEGSEDLTAADPEVTSYNLWIGTAQVTSQLPRPIKGRGLPKLRISLNGYRVCSSLSQS